jgi:PTS system nitrogen regulatory IIA component
VKITDFLTLQAVFPNLVNREKHAVLRELAEYFSTAYPSLDTNKVLDVLEKREKDVTTAIGDGVAIPHGKLGGVQRVLGILARSPEGVDFASLDGGPTHLFVALIVPQDAAADHLKALARISRLLKDGAFRRRLLAGKDSQELYTLIAEEDDKF